MADTSLIIGIDFGTTYSGVAWCWSGQPDNIDIVTRWKSQKYMASDNAKAPTQIYYDANASRSFWGYDIPADVEPLSWFKLLLMDRELLPEEFRKSKQIRAARKRIHEEGKDVVTVVADFLRALWKHTIDAITRDRGKSAVNAFPFKVWVTVPAIWDEGALKNMRRAAQKAGILDRRAAGRTQLEFVAEPEAAAFAVLNDFKGRPDIGRGDVFVVCDAGGGTVDLISYEVISTDPLRFRECVEGDGKMCGAIFVDEAFKSTLEARLGSKWARMGVASQKALLNNEWEHGIKRQFRDEDQEYTVTISPEAFDTRRPTLNRFGDSNKDVPLEHGQLRFKRGHIRTWFHAVLPHIRGLIHKQVTAIFEKKGYNPKAIMLVGGLGSCEYLYDELSQEFDPKDITVLQPNGPRPWTAICRGAVIRGLSELKIRSTQQATLLSRVSRLNYGITYTTEFKEGVHLRQDRYWDDVQLQYRAQDQMQWYLFRGQDIDTQDPLNLRYRTFYDGPEEYLTVTLMKCASKDPPTRADESVLPLKEFAAKIPVPYEDLPIWRNSKGEEFRFASWNLEMRLTGAVMNWQLYVCDHMVYSEDMDILTDDGPLTLKHV